MVNIVNICFITDTNYAVPTGVAIESLIENCKKDTMYNIYIIAVNVGEKIINKFKKLKEHNVNVYVINTENIYSDIQTTHQHVSKAAMLKFNLPNMFPDLDKILYLDGDMLILGDLYDLYSTNLNGKYAAVVTDMKAMVNEKHHLKLGIDKYFNSGMMLLNLKKMRENNSTDKLLYAKKHDKYKHFMDQDALNKVFNENVIYVSLKYNCMLQNLDYPDNEISDFYQEKDIEKILKKPVILHLTNKKKPWNSEGAPGSALWDKYNNCYQIKTSIVRYILSFVFKHTFINGRHKFYIFGIKFLSYKLHFAPDSIIKRNFLFAKEYCSNGRIHVYFCGIKILSYKR